VKRKANHVIVCVNVDIAVAVWVGVPDRWTVRSVRLTRINRECANNQDGSCWRLENIWKKNEVCRYIFNNCFNKILDFLPRSSCCSSEMWQLCAATTNGETCLSLNSHEFWRFYTVLS
jgi:hypothetical protein